MSSSSAVAALVFRSTMLPDDAEDVINPLEQHAVRHLLPSQAAYTEDEKQSEDTRQPDPLIPYIAPLSSADNFSTSLFLSPTPTSLLNKPNLVQLRWRARLPAPTARSASSTHRRSASQRSQAALSFLPLLRRLPVFEPLSYRLHTTATLPLSDDEYLTFTPSITYTPHSSSSSLLLAYHTLLSPSLSSSLALDLASPASLTASTSVLLPSTAVTLTLRGESDGVSVKGGWKQQLGSEGAVAAAEVTAVGCREQSVWVGYVKERRDGRRGGRVGILVRSTGLVEVSGRIVRPLRWCPPFNRCYLQATSLHHAGTSPLDYLPVSHDPSLPLSALPAASAVPIPSDALLSPLAISFITPAHLSLEVGVGAHLNPQHSVDVGIGWSTLGCYFNVALSSSQSTFSFPVYITSPVPVSASSLPILFSLAVGTPVAFCLLYSLLVSPLYRHYTRRSAVWNAAESVDATAYAQLQGVVERIAMQQPAQYTQPQLTTHSPSSASSILPPPLSILAAMYGWRRGGSGEVHGLDVSGVLRFWVRGGRLRLSGCRKRRMLGFGVVGRQEWMVGEEWVLGVLVVYTSGGVLREVWVGECDAAELPSEQHRTVLVNGPMQQAIQ